MSLSWIMLYYRSRFSVRSVSILSKPHWHRDVYRMVWTDMILIVTVIHFEIWFNESLGLTYFDLMSPTKNVWVPVLFLPNCWIHMKSYSYMYMLMLNAAFVEKKPLYNVYYCLWSGRHCARFRPDFVVSNKCTIVP